MTSQLQISIMQTSLLSDEDKRLLFDKLNKEISHLEKPKKKKTLTIKQKIEAGIITADM